jgi:hypothetical protein
MHWHNQDEMNSIIDNIEWNIMSDYQQTKWFQLDFEKDVPVTEYQFELAIHLTQRILPSYTDKLQKIYQQYLTCRRVD